MNGSAERFLARLAAAVLTLIFVHFLAFLAPVQAGPINWKIAGPEGGEIKCFASPDATGTIIYAGCDGGVFKSHDAGEHWQALRNSPPRVSCLAVNPANANILYAGWPNGVSRSTDGGSTWQICLPSTYSAADPGRTPTGLAVDPSNPQRVYATFNNTITVSDKTHGPFCVSTDGGQTWDETVPNAFDEWGSVPPKIYNISHLTIDPFQPRTIYVINGTEFRSEDAGQNFWKIRNGNSNLYAQPDVPGVLYSYTTNGLSRSNDRGDTWFPTYAPGGDIRSVISHQGLGWAVLAGYKNLGVYKGYYPFTSGVWTELNYGLNNGLYRPGVNTLNTFVPYGAFAGTDSGVFRTDSLNFSGDWHPKNQGLTNTAVTCLARSLDPHHTIYAGIGGRGIFKTTDRGRTWQALNNGISVPEGIGLRINGLAVEYPNYFKLYAATNLGLFKSTDGGANWSSTEFTSFASSVLTDPQDPGTVYLRATKNNYDWDTWVSKDAGLTWGSLNQPGYGPLTLIGGPTSFPLYTVGDGTVQRMLAPGQAWQTVFSETSCASLAVDFRSCNILYAGTEDQGVYMSSDFGEHWTRIEAYTPPLNSTPQRRVNAIAVDPANSDVYVGMQNGGWLSTGPNQPLYMVSGGLWKSSDGGVTWTDLQLPPFRGVSTLYLDIFTKTIYCGLQDAGVAVSNPFGTESLLFLLLGD